MPTPNPTRADLPDVPPSPIGQVTALVSVFRTLIDVIGADWERLTAEEEPHSILADGLVHLAEISDAVNEAHHRRVTGSTAGDADLRSAVAEAAHYVACVERTAERVRAEAS